MDAIDPLSRKISKRGKVLFDGERSSQNGPLARRGRATLRRFTANNPAHRRIMPQPLGVVHILISCEAAEHGLSQQLDPQGCACCGSLSSKTA
jgi:hypothetical protein